MDRAQERHRLVVALGALGITDERVLGVLRRVSRELFVLPEDGAEAYANHPLPIGHGQTISQPYMVALMTQELGLRGHERVLEIGTGSGYQAAILAELCAQVITIERLAELSQRASRVLTDLGLGNVRCLVGDGSLGWPPEAPYDGVLVTAGAPEIPWGLYDQLAEEGRLVIPVGKGVQTLKTIQKTRGGPRVREVCDCVFVPLIGANAWAST